MKKILALLSFFAIIFSYSSVLADFNKCSVEQMERSATKNRRNVFYIYVKRYNKKKKLVMVGSGTAFVVDKESGILATAKHIVYRKKLRVAFVRIEDGKKVYFKKEKKNYNAVMEKLEL